jgi:hypothetical protein
MVNLCASPLASTPAQTLSGIPGRVGGISAVRSSAWIWLFVHHEALVRREARITEGGGRPPRLAVAAAGWELGAA